MPETERTVLAGPNVEGTFNRIFDLRNISLFKKVTFPGLEEGQYVVKVFRENLVLSPDKKFMAYAVVDLKKNERIHVFCRSEASLKVKVSDQEENMVMDAEVLLQKKGATISRVLTDENGIAVIKAPIDLSTYDLKVLYNGLPIYHEPVKLRIMERVIPPERHIKIERYNLKLNIFDTWGQTPEIDLNPSISINDEEQSIGFSGEKIKDNCYIFRDIIPNIYQLSLC